MGRDTGVTDRASRCCWRGQAGTTSSGKSTSDEFRSEGVCAVQRQLCAT